MTRGRLRPSDAEFVLCDLDGVVWLAHVAIPGSPEAVERLRRSGRRVVFVTNNSSARVEDQEAALSAIGIPAVGDVITSAQAAASLIDPDETVLVCGGPGVVEAMEERGARVVRDGAADVVVVGYHRDFDYERMRIAHRAILDGARFVATNDDATYPTPDGPIPGGGAIVASIATAAGLLPTIAGKPHQPIADLIRARCGPSYSADTALVVGDRPETDGALAATIGCPFALVRSGVTLPGEPIVSIPKVDLIDVDDLSSVADEVLRSAGEIASPR